MKTNGKSQNVFLFNKGGRQNGHLPTVYYMASRALGVLYTLSYLILMTIPRGVCYLSHFTDERTERCNWGQGGTTVHGCGLRCQCSDQALTFMSCHSLGHTPHLPVFEGYYWFIISSHRSIMRDLRMNMCKAFIKVPNTP